MSYIFLAHLVTKAENEFSGREYDFIKEKVLENECYELKTFKNVNVELHRSEGKVCILIE